MVEVEDLFAYLAGDWLLSRTINDLRLNMPGAMEGRAAFSPRDGEVGDPGLAYREEGELRFGTYREMVFRAYDLTFPDRHLARVRFTDGRPFHDLDLRRGECRVEHPCGEDIYRGRFRAESADVWTSDWFITGPSKELTLENRYRRVP